MHSKSFCDNNFHSTSGPIVANRDLKNFECSCRFKDLFPKLDGIQDTTGIIYVFTYKYQNIKYACLAFFNKNLLIFAYHSCTYLFQHFTYKCDLCQRCEKINPEKH